MNKHRILFYLVFVLLSVNTFAQVEFKRYWYCTPEDTISGSNIRQQAFKQLKNAHQPPDFYSKAVYWFRVDIENSQPHLDLIINIPSPNSDSVILFQEIDGKIIPTDTSGNNFKLKDSISLRYVQFKVNGNTTSVWLKTRLKKQIPFPVTVSTVDKFNRTEQLNFLWMGLYYGFVMVVLTFNIIFYLGFKEPKFLYYSILVLLLALAFAYSDGLYALLSSNQVFLNYSVLPILLATAIAGVVFSASFLGLKHHLFLQWASVVLIVVMCACYVGYALFDKTILLLTGHIIGPFLFSLYWLAALFRFKTDVSARFFVFAYALSLVFAFDHFLLRNIGYSVLNFLPAKLKFSNILQMIILSLGIMNRAKKVHKEHAYYRNEIERYLKNTANDIFSQLQEKFGLSERETEVLELLAEGYTNQQIGDKMYLSLNTVKFHIRNLYYKMDISNRTQAVNRIHEIKSDNKT